MADAYAELLTELRALGQLEALDALLEWDQDVFMPPRGVNPRAELAAFVAAEKHARRTSPRMTELLAQLPDPAEDTPQATNIREAHRAHARAANVPQRLVEEIARVSALARATWAAARKADDFSQFAPHLTQLVALKREQAAAIGYEDDPYDALIDEFEPGTTSAAIGATFAELRARLVPLVQKIAGATRRPDPTILHKHCPSARQAALCRYAAETIGYDFEAGRIDVTLHPFCMTVGGCDDVRITTRYVEPYFPTAVFCVLHEAGHALYEQGLEAEHVFTPMGTSCSLGIHESQSRMWENMVGRSREFWEAHYAKANELLGDTLAGISLDAFCGAVNHVTPSLIRVEADEVTYNLHVIVRFELERDIINGRLEVADIPAAWNAKMTELVGVAPDNDADGCLQDIHWSLGVFGYFPTYALGNLYAAQFYAAAERDIGDLAARIRGGDTRPLLDWLRKHVHRHGMRYRANELCERATGQPLAVDPLMTYLESKYAAYYG
jgi:carboxypeptidase Taq